MHVGWLGKARNNVPGLFVYTQQISLLREARYTTHMTEVLHANIFFFIASVGVILFTLLVCVALYHVVKILRSIRRIVERVEEGSETIAEDVAQLRSYVVSGSLFSQIISFFMGTKATRSRSRSRKADNE